MLTSNMTLWRTLFGAALLFSACDEIPADPLAAFETCRVTRIVDGDTIDCDTTRIRLLLIDAPERNQAPFGAQASDALARLIPVGSAIGLEYDVNRTDRFGRTLAYLHTTRGTLVNEALVRQGYAVPLVYAPNVRHVERIRAAADAAKAARAGLWAVDGFACLPVDARAGRC